MPCATLREMLEAGVHFGHQTRYWNPSMAPYIFGERNKIHIINLEITQRMLDEAVEQVRQWAAEGKTILIVGTKRAAQDIVKSKAEECAMPYVSQRWLGGTLTNFHTVRNSLKRLQDLKRMEGENLMARISKKEALRLTREKLKLERSLGGIEEMERLPDALFVIDVRYENIAVREAQPPEHPGDRGGRQQQFGRRHRPHHSRQRRCDPVDPALHGRGLRRNPGREQAGGGRRGRGGSARSPGACREAQGPADQAARRAERRLATGGGRRRGGARTRSRGGGGFGGFRRAS